MWLKSGRLYDVDTGTFRNADLCIEGTTITAIGRAPAGAEAVDLDGAWLLPGFFDCHVHICVDTASPDPNNPWRHALPGTIALFAARSARRMLMAGITTAREVGGWDYHEIAVREAIEAGWIEGPRLFCAGRILTITSSSTPYYRGMYEEADGGDAVRRAARAQLAQGADFIKLLASGAITSTRYERADAIQYRADEIRAAVEIANDNHTHVAAHAHATEAIRNAVTCGCRSVEHGTYGDPETWALMREHGTWLVPTVCTTPAMMRDPQFAAAVPAHIHRRYEEVHEIQIANLRGARAAGVRIAMGSDAGTPGNHCGDNLQELEVMVGEAGFSPAEAIRSATVAAAELLGIDDRLGRLEPGMRADVVACERNPLEDISALREIGFVARDGVVYRNDRAGSGPGA